VNFGVETAARVRVCALFAHERSVVFFQRQPVVEGLAHVVLKSLTRLNFPASYLNFVTSI
jgi:hypothetical protein